MKNSPSVSPSELSAQQVELLRQVPNEWRTQLANEGNVAGTSEVQLLLSCSYHSPTLNALYDYTYKNLNITLLVLQDFTLVALEQNLEGVERTARVDLCDTLDLSERTVSVTR